MDVLLLILQFIVWGKDAIEEAKKVDWWCERFLVNSCIGIAIGRTVLAVNTLCIRSADFTLCAIRHVEACRASQHSRSLQRPRRMASSGASIKVSSGSHSSGLQELSKWPSKKLTSFASNASMLAAA